MGKAFSILYKEGTLPDVEPLSDSKPTFDPHFGFEARRKERDPKISEDELRALKIHRKHWDYCSYFLKELYVCRKDKKPFFVLCKNEVHNYKQCHFDDYVHRMKEFERERRLRLREKRIKEMSSAA